MNGLVEIECDHGLIKGSWINNGISFDFKGALFKNEESNLNVEFSVPFSFIRKYGEQTILDEIKSSVEEYIETSLSKHEENA